jgi:hypothetical protein
MGKPMRRRPPHRWWRSWSPIWLRCAAALLECRMRDNGFPQLRCGDCGYDRLRAFGCKGRGFRSSQRAAGVARRGSWSTLSGRM